MKKLMMILSCTGLFVLQACSQGEGETEVPQVVEEAFNSKFSNTTNVDWDKENDEEWEAEFEMDGKDYSANFSTDGTWKETEHEVQGSELPQSVSTTLETEFSEYEIEKAEIAEKVNGTVYEIELENGDEEIEVVIDSSGKVMKKETENEDED